MAARAALARLSLPQTPRALSTSALSIATSRAALATGPLARVARSPSVLVPRRSASTDDGAQTMVSV